MHKPITHKHFQNTIMASQKRVPHESHKRALFLLIEPSTFNATVQWYLTATTRFIRSLVHSKWTQLRCIFGLFNVTTKCEQKCNGMHVLWIEKRNEFLWDLIVTYYELHAKGRDHFFGLGADKLKNLPSTNNWLTKSFH